MNAQRPLFAADENIGDLRSSSGVHLRVAIDRATSRIKLVKLDEHGKALGAGLELSHSDVNAVIVQLRVAQGKLGGGA